MYGVLYVRYEENIKLKKKWLYMENSELISIIHLCICLFIYLFTQLDFKAHKKGNLLPYNGSINGSFEVGLNSFPSVGLCTFSIFPGSL